MRRLVDKLYALGYKHTLELEFLFESARFYPDLGFGALLPKFREKGRVRALNISSGEVLDLPVSLFRDTYHIVASNISSQ